MNEDDLFGDVVITDLPPHPRNTRDRLRPLFLKALQHRVMHPDLAENQGWFKIYDRIDELARSIPKDYCIEGAISTEQILEDVKRKRVRAQKWARFAEPELGRFTVQQRSGAIYIKHTGRVPKGKEFNDWI